MASQPFKAVLAYNREPGIGAEEYDDWLYNVHIPDLLANPFLDKMVVNTTRDVVHKASDGTPVTKEGAPVPFRVAELHFSDEQAFHQYTQWFAAHPPARERGPSGRTDFMFYVITEVQEFTREHPPIWPKPTEES